jgi:hypothetical protein
MISIDGNPAYAPKVDGQRRRQPKIRHFTPRIALRRLPSVLYRRKLNHGGRHLGISDLFGSERIARTSENEQQEY